MSAFSALKHRDFALYFTGQWVSMVGTWVQNMTLGWWLYRLTGRESMLGLAVFVTTAPSVLLSPFGGLAADRLSALRVVLLAQIGLLVQAGAMAWLAFQGNTQVWPILVLAALLGVATAFDNPGRLVLVAQVVPREDLPNAIALSSVLFHGARILGPALAGLILAAGHEGWCFLLNAASYLASLAVLLAMRPREEPRAAGPRSALADVKEGLRYLGAQPQLRLLLAFCAVIVALGMPFTALMPAMVKEILQAGPRELGWLMGSSGTGATLGALALASRKDPRDLDRLMPMTAAAFALLLAAFSQSRILGLSCGLLALTSFALVSTNTSNTTLLQILVPDALRGRIMALYGMVFMGAMPVGTLASSLLAERIGVPGSLLLGSAGCLLGALLFWRLYPRSRP